MLPKAAPGDEDEAEEPLSAAEEALLSLGLSRVLAMCPTIFLYACSVKHCSTPRHELSGIHRQVVACVCAHYIRPPPSPTP